MKRITPMDALIISGFISIIMGLIGILIDNTVSKPALMHPKIGDIYKSRPNDPSELPIYIKIIDTFDDIQYHRYQLLNHDFSPCPYSNWVSPNSDLQLMDLVDPDKLPKPASQ